MSVYWYDTKPIRELLGKLRLELLEVERKTAVYKCEKCEHETPASELTQKHTRKDAGYNDMSFYDAPRVYLDYYTVACPKCSHEKTEKEGTSFLFIEVGR